MRKTRIKKKLKNNVIGATFAFVFVAYVAAIGSIGEPGFTWDRLPAILIVAGASLAYIMLVGYANRPRPEGPEQPEQSGGEKCGKEAA